jgi:hypothetical protein
LKDKFLCTLPANNGRKVLVYMDKEGNPYILIDRVLGELGKNISNYDRKWWVASIHSTSWNNTNLSDREKTAIYKLKAALDWEHRHEYA